MQEYRNSKNKNIQTSLLNFLQNQNSMEEKINISIGKV